MMHLYIKQCMYWTPLFMQTIIFLICVVVMKMIYPQMEYGSMISMLWGIGVGLPCVKVSTLSNSVWFV